MNKILKDNKSKIVLIFILLIILILAFHFLRTYSIFESETNTNFESEIAFFCVDDNFQTINLRLDELSPRSEPYIYDFRVSNFNTTKRAEVDIIYDLTLRMTTNLPLNYSLVDLSTGTSLSNLTLYQDDENTYFYRFEVPDNFMGYRNNVSNQYRLIIGFPETYTDSVYQNIIELVEINVDSRQVVE